MCQPLWKACREGHLQSCVSKHSAPRPPGQRGLLLLDGSESVSASFLWGWRHQLWGPGRLRRCILRRLWLALQGVVRAWDLLARREPQGLRTTLSTGTVFRPVPRWLYPSGKCCDLAKEMDVYNEPLHSLLTPLPPTPWGQVKSCLCRPPGTQLCPSSCRG